MRYFLLLLLCTIFSCADARANVHLPAIISDNMVLQQNKPIPIWGTADPGELIGVKLGDQAAVAKADDKGHWQVTLQKTAAGGPYTLIVHGKNEFQLKNVMVGEVWLISGQGNMDAPYAMCEHTDEDTNAANNPQLRFFKVPGNVSAKPLTATSGQWRLSSSESVLELSSIGYYIGKELQQNLHVTVGIVQSTYPDARIEQWVSRDTMDKNNEFSGMGAKSDSLDEEYRSAQSAYNQFLSDWEENAAAARKAAKPEPPQPVPPVKAKLGLVGSAFNGEIDPVAPYAVRGCFYYGGERDVGPLAAVRWRKLFNLMVQDWRLHFNDATLPFYYVQLPNLNKRTDKPGESLVADLREAQAMCRRIPFAWFIVAIDTTIGVDADNNPHDKRTIASRLAHAAMATQYHINVPYASPLYDSMEIQGNKILLHFRYAEKGLIAKGLPVRGFQIAGEDQKFRVANAELEGDSVLVWSDKVPKPVAVRYAWADNPEANLYNAQKMPAAPFRTDTWKAANPADKDKLKKI